MHPLLMPARYAAQLITIHDLDFLDHPERTRAEIRRDYPALARDHARRADHIVVNSQHTADAVVARFGIDPAKISICFPGAPSWAVRETEPSPGCLLFLGTLEPRKNLSTLLDAYEALVARRPDTIPLVLAGRATPAAADIVARVSRPPLAGRVQLTGYVTDQERIEWYGRARALVLPSHMEGFGMTAVEAMASGVPVIAANRGALVESVGGAGRLIDPDDASAWSRAIEEILSSDGTRRQMREAGLAQAQRFHWRETAAGVRRAWNQAIAHRQARRG
jgi:glycosyltransferase involved in cell wall biosynthesis